MWQDKDAKLIHKRGCVSRKTNKSQLGQPLSKLHITEALTGLDLSKDNPTVGRTLGLGPLSL